MGTSPWSGRDPPPDKQEAAWVEPLLVKGMLQVDWAKSNSIISYPIVSYRILSYHIVSYRTVPYSTVPCRIVSYCTVPRRVVSRSCHSIVVSCHRMIKSHRAASDWNISTRVAMSHDVMVCYTVRTLRCVRVRYSTVQHGTGPYWTEVDRTTDRIMHQRPRPFACMHACMHVCMYACMHVCMYACRHVCVYACRHHECIHAYMHVGIMCVCVYVYFPLAFVLFVCLVWLSDLFGRERR